ncbi:LacI family DNA-binding transcriptional regulator [Nonomuraea sp. NPDC049709]|uniref:LacI family DNA-binding transcriptional regulator n=1 Tax=Nonomuraea sp. NPDC049709 TaxID=3154736 RepID=UPI0034480299
MTPTPRRAPRTAARGGAAPSIRDVAAAAGVSYQTVSRVLNESPRVRPETRTAVLAAIERLGFRPSRAARALSLGRARGITVVTSNTMLYGYAATLQGLEEAARAEGMAMGIRVVESAEPAEVKQTVDYVSDASAGGVVVIAFDPLGVAVLEALPEHVPAVAATEPAAPDRGRVAIALDERRAAADATRHLLALGHRTVHHVAIPSEGAPAATGKTVAGDESPSDVPGHPVGGGELPRDATRNPQGGDEFPRDAAEHPLSGGELARADNALGGGGRAGSPSDVSPLGAGGPLDASGELLAGGASGGQPVAGGRLAGWRDALREAGAEIPEVLACGWDVRSAYAAGQRLAAAPDVTAILCGNDDIAQGVRRALYDAGKDVPGDVSIVGFDDIPGSAYWTPALTTVRMDFAGLGRACFRAAVAELTGQPQPELALTPPTLVLRESTAPPPRA